MNASRSDKIESVLREAFSPTELRIKDQSHLHAGHAGAEDGRGHFEVFIVSEDFEGLRSLQRHRLIYAALGGLMDTDIHALRIKSHTAAEI
jgi:BolA protein